MTVLFISDLHLDPDRPDISKGFLQFLQAEATHASALYILGDLFESWIGDDYMAPYQQEIDALTSLSKQGVKLYFMHGNRDFLVGDTLSKYIGCKLLSDPTVIQPFSQPILLMHGDSLCTNDKAYMAFRNQVRNPEWQHMMLAKPINDRLAIAQHLRQLSQLNNGNKPDNIMDVTPGEVILTMEQHNVHLFIHGHTHRPAIHPVTTKIGDSTRIVLGDWNQKGWVLKLTAEDYQLVSFPLKQ